MLRSVAFISLCVLLTACASSGTMRTGTAPRPQPFPRAAVPPDASAPPTATLDTPPAAAGEMPAQSAPPSLITMALAYAGIPYRMGGSNPSSGFDCSGFVQWVFARAGITLPREVREQFHAGEKIDRDDIAPGDLVFFDTSGRGASHVGIALGGDRFIHAPSSRGVVRVESYLSDYWNKRYVGARRVPQLSLPRDTEAQRHKETN